MPNAMSLISSCDVLECVYNQDSKCHTIAITVGNGGCPMCDTYAKGNQKGGARDIDGGVGACRTADCKYNARLECTAPSIHVGWHSGHADCTTYVHL